MADTTPKQLDQIKGLLIVLLMKLGTNSKELSLALGIHDSDVRRRFPAKKVRRIDQSEVD